MTTAKFSPLLAILIITLLVTGCMSSTPTPQTIEPTTQTIIPTPTQTAETQLAIEIDDFLTTLAGQERLSGSILVAMDGKVLISKGYSMANLELDVPNTPQTKFQLASITKQFTAMAILQLQQQGKLNLDDPICQYISDCPEAWQPITIHHLLTHTSGISEYIGLLGFEDFKRQSVNPDEIIALFRDLPLDFTPGEKLSYSNSGYVVLGYIIERASSEAYAIFLLKNIFVPLQMVNTGYDNSDVVIKNRADGYLGATANADYIDPTVAYAAGGLYSTVEDLFLWDQALYTDKLISQTLRDQMFTPFTLIPPNSNLYAAVPADVTDASYGYGWFVGKQFNHQWISHRGTIEGFRTVINRYPDDKVVIIVLSNRQSTSVEEIASEIAHMIFGEK